MAEQIELVFGVEASLDLSYTVLEANSSISKKHGYFPLKLCFQTLDLENFALALRPSQVLST